MTMTTEKAIEVLRRELQDANGTDHDEAVQTVLDALAAEKQRADEALAIMRKWSVNCADIVDGAGAMRAALNMLAKERDDIRDDLRDDFARVKREAHAAGFRECQERAAKIADEAADESDKHSHDQRTASYEYAWRLARDCERDLAEKIRALAPAAPTDAAAIRSALAELERLRGRAIPQEWVESGELDIYWRRDDVGARVWGYYGEFESSRYVEHDDGTGYTTDHVKHPTLADAIAAAGSKP